VDSLALAAEVDIVRPLTSMHSFLTCVLLLAVKPTITPATPPLPVRVSGPGFEGVIISAEECLASDPRHLLKPSEVWTPSETNVREAEETLPAYISGADATRVLQGSRIPSELARYKRQYWGTVRNGRRELLVLFYHGDTDIVRKGIWSRGILAIAGGGDRFFQVFFSTSTKRFHDLTVNAPE
jgi:hypothetical protein